LVRYYRNRVFRAFFHALPENRLVRESQTRLAAAAILSRSARRSRLPDPLLCSSGLLFRQVGAQIPDGAHIPTWSFTTQVISICPFCPHVCITGIPLGPLASAVLLVEDAKSRVGVRRAGPLPPVGSLP
jgi:hypothetical protein